MTNTTKEAVDHPDYYGGKDNPYECIRVIDAWDLGFCLGNTVKYISRAGKKNGSDTLLQDLKKALWYLNHEIETRSSASSASSTPVSTTKPKPMEVVMNVKTYDPATDVYTFQCSGEFLNDVTQILNSFPQLRVTFDKSNMISLW